MACTPDREDGPALPPHLTPLTPPQPEQLPYDDLLATIFRVEEQTFQLPPLPTLLGGQRAEDVGVKGRHWHRPHVTTLAGDESITLRVDDEHYPELWIELTFTTEQLAELLARVIAMRPNVEAGTNQILRALSRDFTR